jgi:hypothetical protein
MNGLKEVVTCPEITASYFPEVALRNYERWTL